MAKLELRKENSIKQFCIYRGKENEGFLLARYVLERDRVFNADEFFANASKFCLQRNFLKLKTIETDEKFNSTSFPHFS